jgi:two-component system, cell cycle response regulator
VGDSDLSETTLEITVTRDSSLVRRIAALDKAFLVVLAGPKLGHRTLLGEQPLEIGRASGCGLVLDTDSVSRQHARVEWTGVTHRIVDLGSTNGTFVNEHRISEQTLNDGDRLQIGKVLVKYIGGGNIEGAYHEEIQRLMRFDGLTGVHNKSHFEETLHSVIANTRTTPLPVSLSVLDLDYFKRINDSYGHAAGDAVLRQVAGVVAGQLSQHELLARVGGEEFAILCPGLVLRAAYELAERVRRAVESAECRFENTIIPVTLSLGVAERPAGSDETGEGLYERSDTQLYAAKAAGRNCVR